MELIIEPSSQINHVYTSCSISERSFNRDKMLLTSVFNLFQVFSVNRTELQTNSSRMNAEVENICNCLYRNTSHHCIDIAFYFLCYFLFDRVGHEGEGAARPELRRSSGPGSGPHLLLHLLHRCPQCCLPVGRRCVSNLIHT